MLLANRHSHTSAISYHGQLKAFSRGPSLLLCLFLVILAWDQCKLHREVAQEKTSTMPAPPSMYEASSCLSLLSQLSPSTTMKLSPHLGAKAFASLRASRSRSPQGFPQGLNLANQKHNYHWREEREKRFLSFMDQVMLPTVLKTAEGHLKPRSPHLVQK